MAVGREAPIIERTDRHQFEFYYAEGKVVVKKLQIHRGEVVPGQALFTFRLSQFKLYPNVLRRLVEVLTTWLTSRRTPPMSTKS